MDNKRILLKITPFLFLFIFTIGFTGWRFFQQSTAPSQAAGEDVTVQMINTSAPLEQDSLWSWNVLVFVDTYFQDPFSVEYSVHWCGPSTALNTTVPCKPGPQDANYKTQLTTGTIRVNTRNTTSKLTHASVPCGRVGIVVTKDGVETGYGEFDTGTSCKDVEGLGVYANEKEQVNPINVYLNVRSKIKKLIDIFTSEDESDNSTSTPEQSSGGAGETGGDRSNPVSNEKAGTPYGYVGDKTSANVIDFANYLRTNPNCTATNQSGQLIHGIVTKTNMEKCFVDDLMQNQNLTPNFGMGFNDRYNMATKLRSEVSSFAVLQCVGFVKAVSYITTGRWLPGTGAAYQRTGDHDNYAYVSRESGGKPEQHDLIIWGRDTKKENDNDWYAPYGHIAYVLSYTGNTLVILEANYGSCAGCVRRRVIKFDEAYQNYTKVAGYLKPKQLVP